MSAYLNGNSGFSLYQSETLRPYFVDKSDLLLSLFPLVDEGNSYICITRPRRFGKTVMANMIAAFFEKGQDGHLLFDRLHVAESPEYEKHLNNHQVIHIMLNEVPAGCRSYGAYIERICNRLIRDLQGAYPEVQIREGEAVWDILSDVYEKTGQKFLFVLDEWDYIFHQDFITEEDQKAYLQFLSNLLKDKAYISLAYMTGILPIAKYSSGSELNMFAEFTMAKSPMFSDYFGFTDEEVNMLFERYLGQCEKPEVTREGLRLWYDGYATASGKRVYNPRSVVQALRYNHLESYWTSSGPYEEIFYYIRKNVAEVRDDLALMVSGIPVAAKVQEYAVTSMNLSTRDEIFSAMVVYGFLSYENGYVYIPNKELMDQFSDMMQREAALGYVYRLAKASERMLKATLAGDEDTMASILEYAHNTEVPLLSYNREEDLAAIVNLIYLSARDTYRMEREQKAGVGFVDFIFYPVQDMKADGIILELKVNDTAESAIAQIKEKKYALRFAPKMGEEPKYRGRILAVGIAYDKKTKKHHCKVEVL